jgi:hypothetical protein
LTVPESIYVVDGGTGDESPPPPPQALRITTPNAAVVSRRPSRFILFLLSPSVATAQSSLGLLSVEKTTKCQAGVAASGEPLVADFHFTAVISVATADPHRPAVNELIP